MRRLESVKSIWEVFDPDGIVPVLYGDPLSCQRLPCMELHTVPLPAAQGAVNRLSPASCPHHPIRKRT